jgi:16S rRNA (guanine(966)-N(2))-methyltransferase RsmD
VRPATGDAGRVVAGSARGIRLRTVASTTRPLGDRVKQALFAMLEPDLDRARFLDLFAGSGAAGIEALSRGAGNATFVERDPTAVRSIRDNLERTHLGTDRARVVQDDVIAWLARVGRPEPAFDLVLVDPPYDCPDLLTDALDLLGRADAPLSEGATVVAKHFWRAPPSATIGLLASERERRFGETVLTFFRREEVGSAT